VTVHVALDHILIPENRTEKRNPVIPEKRRERKRYSSDKS
jgi:hypothetical protein